MTTLHRPNWLEFDAGALRDNVAAVRNSLPKGTRLFAALKANAYGFGLVGAARAFSAGGVDGFSMADLTDAVLLREAGLTEPILLYGGCLVDKDFISSVERYGISPTVHDETTAIAFAAHLSEPIAVFVKIDCGLERLGILAENATSFITDLVRTKGLRLAGINTHLHVPKAAEGIKGYMEWQVGRFRALCKSLAASGIDVPLTILESTGVLNLGLGTEFNGADPGHLLYGLSSGGPTFAEHKVRSGFLAIKSRLVQVRGADRSAYVDRAPYAVGETRRLGIIPFGLRDGMGNIAPEHVIVRGRAVPVLARPSLEYTRIDLTDVPSAAVGDEVVIIGSQNGTTLAVEDVLMRRGHSRVTDLLITLPPDAARIFLNFNSNRT